MPPLGWEWAGFVWGYALVWFLVSDRVKLLAYRIFDPIKKAAVKIEAHVESPSTTKSRVGVEIKPTVEAKPETSAVTTTDLKPQIAARAYEIYERQGHQDGQSVQNWDEAEREIWKDQIKAQKKPEAEASPTIL